MDFCWTGFVGICLFILACRGIPALIELMEEQAAERKKRAEAEADAKFMRDHPEAWRAKELVKLERERLEAQKEHAAEAARQENTRRNAGLVAGIGRGLGWW
jgi:hypothetical protein